jgi:hypothetical protein
MKDQLSLLVTLIRVICVLLFLAVIFVSLHYRAHRVLINFFLDILGLEPKGNKEIKIDRLQSNFEDAISQSHIQQARI